MAEANQEYREEYVAPDLKTLRENRLKRLEKWLKRWTGEITAEQEELLSDCNEGLQLVGEERLAYRRQWQAIFQRLLARRHEPDFDELLSRFITDQTHSRPATYQRKFEANRTLTQTCILAIDDLMMDRQRDSLLENISELADDLDELAYQIES
jgi:ubiquinone biosynthesis protein UbiJ